MTTAMTKIERQADQREPSDALEALYKKVGIDAVAAAAAYVTRRQKLAPDHDA